ncbi:MAG: hypothetical protein NTZ56_14575 [Acidobacteria bacterium]|nr:hypothetical protein [Acidobacteriota bacterium]
MPTEEMIGPGPATVRAWFDTFFRDLLSALTRERRLLQAENWTWQAKPQKLVMIRPLGQYTDHEYWPNFDQFKRLNQNFIPLMEDHDRSVEELTHCCADYRSALASCPEWAQLREQILMNLTYNSISIDTDELEDSLLDLVVNNSPELLPGFPIAPAWNPNRERLLKLRETPSVSSAYRLAQAAALQLRGATGRCMDFLEQSREGLSLKLDVPIALPSR